MLNEKLLKRSALIQENDLVDKFLFSLYLLKITF